MITVRVAEYVKHTVKQSRHVVEWAGEERSMGEGTVIAENTGGELMQDSVSRTLAIEMPQLLPDSGSQLPALLRLLAADSGTSLLPERSLPGS